LLDGFCYCKNTTGNILIRLILSRGYGGSRRWGDSWAFGVYATAHSTYCYLFYICFIYVCLYLI